MTHPLRAAIEAHDMAAVASLLAEDVKLFNPVRFDPVQGRDLVVAQFRVALDGFDGLKYTDELVSDKSLALVFTASFQGDPVQGVDLFRLDETGLAAEVTVMIRPLPVLASLAEARSRATAQPREQ